MNAFCKRDGYNVSGSHTLLGGAVAEEGSQNDRQIWKTTFACTISYWLGVKRDASATARTSLEDVQCLVQEWPKSVEVNLEDRPDYSDAIRRNKRTRPMFLALGREPIFLALGREPIFLALGREPDDDDLIRWLNLPWRRKPSHGG
jgi:hypothetical protein